jgi:hypothetical protein
MATASFTSVMNQVCHILVVGCGFRVPFNPDPFPFDYARLYGRLGLRLRAFARNFAFPQRKRPPEASPQPTMA